jgi:hypothetical protein
MRRREKDTSVENNFLSPAPTYGLKRPSTPLSESGESALGLVGKSPAKGEDMPLLGSNGEELQKQDWHIRTRMGDLPFHEQRLSEDCER